MDIVKFIVCKFIRLIGNLFKCLYYPVFKIFPNYRFTIPSYSKPLIYSRKKSKIPRILWQTNFTDRVTLPLYINYIFNRLMSPTYEYRFMAQEQCDKFIRENTTDEVNNLYKKISIGAAKADFWRVLVIYKIGGVYVDMDGCFLWPLEFSIPSDIGDIYILKKQGHVSNYFMAGSPGNSNFLKLFNQITENLRSESSENVYDLSGPGVIPQCLDVESLPKIYYRNHCVQGVFSNEFFQYRDHKVGKWTKEQKLQKILKD